VAFELRRGGGLTAAAAEAAAEPVRVDHGCSSILRSTTPAAWAWSSSSAGADRGRSFDDLCGGRELRDSTPGEWLAAAGGSPLAAWIGKLTPYLAYDLVLMAVVVGGFVAWFHIPVRGSLGFLALGALTFSLATKSIGVLLTVWLANLRKALGVGSLFSRDPERSHSAV